MEEFGEDGIPEHPKEGVRLLLHRVHPGRREAERQSRVFKEGGPSA